MAVEELEETADRVGASIGLTINLGNYNSAKVDAWHSTTVRGDETVEAAYERVWAKIEAQIDAKTAEYVED